MNGDSYPVDKHRVDRSNTWVLNHLKSYIGNEQKHKDDTFLNGQPVKLVENWSDVISFPSFPCNQSSG